MTAFTVAGAEALLRVLHRRPREAQPDPGPVPALPTRDHSIAWGPYRPAPLVDFEVEVNSNAGEYAVAARSPAGRTDAVRFWPSWPATARKRTANWASSRLFQADTLQPSTYERPEERRSSISTSGTRAISGLHKARIPTVSDLRRPSRDCVYAYEWFSWNGGRGP